MLSDIDTAIDIEIDVRRANAHCESNAAAAVSVGDMDGWQIHDCGSHDLLQEVRAIMAQYMPLQEQDADLRPTPNGI